MAKADGKKAKKAESKAKGGSKPKADKKKTKKVDVSGGVKALARLADHPLVTDLLAVGAMAAVAAIAAQGVAAKTGKSDAEGSRKAVKAAGKAAAAAIGQRLLKEMGGFGARKTQDKG